MVLPSQAPMSSITSGTTATDVTGCVAPLGHRHEGYEVMYAGDQAAMLPNSNGEDGGLDTRMIWFIEKCRVLENEKLALMELLDETKETIDARDNKIVAYKKSHLELRNLAAELCSKLKRDAAKKEKAEKRVAQLTKQLSAMKARATKAEADLRRSNDNFSKHQVKLSNRLKEAEAKHERFDQMTIEYEEQLRQKDIECEEAQAEAQASLEQQESELAEQVRVQRELEARVAALEAVVTQRDETIADMNKKQQDALLLLGSKITDLEAEMSRRQAEVADSLAAAEAISTQFQEKDQQVMELQTLLQTVSTERDELHLVIRNFESTSEQHAIALAAARRELMKERAARKEMQRQRNLEHMATQDMQRKLRATFESDDDGDDDGDDAASDNDSQ